MLAYAIGAENKLWTATSFISQSMIFLLIQATVILWLVPLSELIISAKCELNFCILDPFHQ